MAKQHSPGFLKLVTDCKQRIQEITPQALKDKLVRRDELCLIDVREDSEWNSSGHIPSAIHLSRGILERDIEKQFPDYNRPVVLYCSGGFRCALAADSLQQMGYQHVYSLKTGLQGWIDAGFEIEDVIR